MARVIVRRTRDNGWLKIDFCTGRYSSTETIDFEFLEIFGGKKLAEQARLLLPGDEIELDMLLRPPAIEVAKAGALGLVKRLAK